MAAADGESIGAEHAAWGPGQCGGASKRCDEAKAEDKAKGVAPSLASCPAKSAGYSTAECTGVAPVVLAAEAAHGSGCAGVEAGAAPVMSFSSFAW